MKQLSKKHFIKRIGLIIVIMVQITMCLHPLSVNASNTSNQEAQENRKIGLKKGIESVKDNSRIKDKSTPSGIPYSKLKDKIQRFIEERKEGMASLSLEVFDHSQTLYESYNGYANMNQKLAVDEDTVYEWGSVSKLLIWISVMQLYEQGKLDLNRDIREYLPKGFLSKLSYKTPITMINLMNHTAGWQETTYDIETKDKSKIVPLKKALMQSEPAQIYKPGTVCAYSNWGASLAAYIVESITGEEFYDYVKNNIFNPLGMEHTSYAPDCSDNKWVQKQRKMLNCYSITDESKEDYGSCISYILLYPAGSATGTLKDMLTFSKAFVPNEKESCPFFQKKDTLDRMLRATSYYGDSSIPRNSHGLWVLPYATNIYGHNGNTSGCTSTLMFDPISGLGIVIMTNECGETAFNYGLLSLLYGEYKGNGTNITKSTNMSGMYTLARSYGKGFSKIYHIIGSLMPLSQTANKKIYKLSVGQGRLTQISNHEYIMDNENGWKYLMYLNQTADGKTTLQMMSSDCIKENTVTFIMKIIGIILGFLSVIYAIISLIRILLTTVVKKLFRKKQATFESKSIRIGRIMTLLSILASAFMVYLIILLPLDSASITLKNTWWKCTIIGILSLIPAWYTALLYINSKEFHGSRKQKVKYILTAVGGMIFSLNIWYWQMYNFWSC